MGRKLRRILTVGALVLLAGCNRKEPENITGEKAVTGTPTPKIVVAEEERYDLTELHNRLILEKEQIMVTPFEEEEEPEETIPVLDGIKASGATLYEDENVAIEVLSMTKYVNEYYYLDLRFQNKREIPIEGDFRYPSVNGITIDSVFRSGFAETDIFDYWEYMLEPEEERTVRYQLPVKWNDYIGEPDFIDVAFYVTVMTQEEDAQCLAETVCHYYPFGEEKAVVPVWEPQPEYTKCFENDKCEMWILGVGVDEEEEVSYVDICCQNKTDHIVMADIDEQYLNGFFHSRDENVWVAPQTVTYQRLEYDGDDIGEPELGVITEFCFELSWYDSSKKDDKYFPEKGSEKVCAHPLGKDKVVYQEHKTNEREIVLLDKAGFKLVATGLEFNVEKANCALLLYVENNTGLPVRAVWEQGMLDDMKVGYEEEKYFEAGMRYHTDYEMSHHNLEVDTWEGEKTSASTLSMPLKIYMIEGEQETLLLTETVTITREQTDVLSVEEPACLTVTPVEVAVPLNQEPLPFEPCVPQTVLENELVTLELVSVSEQDEKGNYIAKFRAVNKTNLPYYVDVTVLSMNKVDFWAEAYAQMQEGEELYFDCVLQNLEYCDMVMGEVTELELEVKLREKWRQGVVYYETQTNCYPYGEPAVRADKRGIREGDVVLLDNEYCKMVLTGSGKEVTTRGSYGMYFYFENRTEETLKIMIGSAHFDDYRMSPYCSEWIEAGYAAYCLLTQNGDELELCGITSLVKAELDIKISAEREDEEYIYFDDVICVYPKGKEAGQDTEYRVTGDEEVVLDNEDLQLVMTKWEKTESGTLRVWFVCNNRSNDDIQVHIGKECYVNDVAVDLSTWGDVEIIFTLPVDRSWNLVNSGGGIDAEAGRNDCGYMYITAEDLQELGIEEIRTITFSYEVRSGGAWNWGNRWEGTYTVEVQ